MNEVDREEAGTITYIDLQRMLHEAARLDVRPVGWAVRPSTMPVLMLMQDTAGMYLFNNVHNRICGLPISKSSEASHLGSKGDITLETDTFPAQSIHLV